MRCPECQKKLEQFAIACPSCRWSLTAEIEKAAVRNPGSISHSPNSPSPGRSKSEFEMLYQSALNSLEADDAETALRTINQAVQSVSDERHWEALAVRGYIQYQLGNHFDAIQDCTEAIDAGWQDARTFAWRAAALAAEQRWPEAFEDLRHASRLAGSSRERYRQLEQGYLAEAEVYYLAELEKSPNHPSLLRQLGWCYLLTGSAEKAHNALQRCLQIDEHEARAWLGKARLAVAAAEWPQAEFAATRAMLSEDPLVNFEARAELARSKQLSGNRAGATTALKQLRTLAKNEPRLQQRLAELYQEFGNPAASLNILRELLAAHPDFLPGILTRAAAYHKLKNHSLEIAQYDHYLRLRPNAQHVLLARAEAYLASQKFDQAIEDATESLQLDVLETDAYLVRAGAFHAKQDYTSALNEVQHALKLDDRYPPAYFLLGKQHVGLGEFEKAVASFTRAIELLPADDQRLRGECHYFRGTTCFELGRYQEAASDFEQVIRCNPTHAGAWVWLAAAKSKLGQWQETVQYLLRSQTVQPALARQYRLLGRSLATNAIEEFSRQLPADEPSDSASLDPRFRSDGLFPFERNTTPVVLEPNAHAARVGRAMAFQFLGENEAAVRDYCHAIRSAPEELELWFRRGQVWQQLGEDKRAVRDLSHVIHRQREHHQARFYRAVSSARLGETDRAISDLIKALRLAPQNTRYHLLRGELNSHRGRYSKAIRCYQRAESLDPGNSSIFRLRGEARWKRGQIREALADWTRALELKADQGDVYALRAKALLRCGKPSAAKADFEQAIRLAPRNLTAVIGRAEALTALKRYQSALLWLTKSLHSFNNAQGLADLLLARGRVYLAMGIWPKAAADASTALDLRRDNVRVQTAARFLRARALIQMEQNPAAARDLKKLLRIAPDHASAIALSDWLQSPQHPRPAEVQTLARPVKISKPKIVQSPIALNGSADSWGAEGIFDTWLVRDQAREEYGPVSKATLNRWVEEGRVSSGMHLLRGDWHKWRRVEKVFPELGTTR